MPISSSMACSRAMQGSELRRQRRSARPSQHWQDWPPNECRFVLVASVGLC